MIRPQNHRHLVWFFAAVFAAITGVGEGLHMLPGMGHAIRLPDGSYLGLAREGAKEDPTDRVQPPTDPVLPLIDSDQCPICNHLSLISPTAQAVSIVAAPVWVADLPVCDRPAPRPCVAEVFRARGPPPV